MKLRADIPDLDISGIMGELLGALEGAQQQTADEAPGIVTARILQGREPGGGSLPSLQASTIERKGSSKALVADRVLTNPGEWQQTTSGKRIEVEVPESRTQAVIANEKLGFDVFADRDPDLQRAADRNMQEAADRIDLRSHIQSRPV